MTITYEDSGGITTEATSNSLFLGPGTPTADTYYTMDDIVTAFPTLVEKQEQAYIINDSIVVAGASDSRAVNTARSPALYFTGGVLSNDGAGDNNGNMSTIPITDEVTGGTINKTLAYSGSELSSVTSTYTV